MENKVLGGCDTKRGTRWRIARVILKDPQILVLDEVRSLLLQTALRSRFTSLKPREARCPEWPLHPLAWGDPMGDLPHRASSRPSPFLLPDRRIAVLGATIPGRENSNPWN